MSSTLKQAENKPFDAALARAPVGLCMIDAGDAHLPVLYANDLFTKMMPQGLPENVTTALKAGEPVAALDLPLDDAGGWGRLTLTHVLAEGKKTAIVWLSDISETRRAAREAAAILEMKSSFLASMSHEIRTPMQSVYG